MSTNQEMAVDLLNLGAARKREGRYDEALSLYNKASKLDSSNEMIPYSKAKLYYILSLYDEAVQSYLDYFVKKTSYVMSELWIGYTR